VFNRHAVEISVIITNKKKDKEGSPKQLCRHTVIYICECTAGVQKGKKTSRVSELHNTSLTVWKSSKKTRNNNKTNV